MTPPPSTGGVLSKQLFGCQKELREALQPLTPPPPMCPSTEGRQDPGLGAKVTVGLSWASWLWGTAFSVGGRRGWLPHLMLQPIARVFMAEPARHCPGCVHHFPSAPGMEDGVTGQAQPRETAKDTPHARVLALLSGDPWPAG